MVGYIAEVVAFLSIIGHFVQHFHHKSQEKILLGFLHALKPPIEAASKGDAVPLSVWQGELNQIHDMVARLQPTKKH